MLFVLRAFIVSSIKCILDLRGGGRAGEEEEGKIKVGEEGKRRAETDQHLHLHAIYTYFDYPVEKI